jgi:hypothetical protein
LGYPFNQNTSRVERQKHAPAKNGNFARPLSSGRFCFEVPQRRCDELILLSTKLFWAPDATVLKPLPGNGHRNEAPERRIQGAQIVKTGEYDVQSRYF